MAAQQPVEMILLRQLASYLAIPLWMMDEAGNLIYYNGPAEGLLGVEFDEVGPIHADQLAELFEVSDLDGNPVPDSELPIVIALAKQLPAHRALRIRALDGVWREIEVSAVPVSGQGDRFLGAFATFWETEG